MRRSVHLAFLVLLLAATFSHQASAQSGIGGCAFSPCQPSTTISPNATLQSDSNGSLFFAPITSVSACQNITTFGGDGNNSTDNSAAMTAALASQIGSPCVYFPRGTYFFSTAVTYTLAANSAITIRGDGADVSNIRTPAGVNAISIITSAKHQSAHVDGLTFIASGINSGTGLSITNSTGTFDQGQQSNVTITNTTFRGSDSYGAQTECWANGFYTNYVSNINFVNDLFFGCPQSGVGDIWGLGSGITLFGGATMGVIYNVTDCIFEYLNAGIYYGENIQGVAVSQSNFTPDTYGILVPSSAVGSDQLSVVGSQFGFNSYGILEQTGVVNTTLTGNVTGGAMQAFLNVSGTGLQLFSITGNSLQGFEGSLGISSSVGLNFVDGTDGVISGNNISGWYYGVGLNAATSNITVQDNEYTGNANANVSSGSATNRITGNVVSYGVVAGAVDNGSGLVRLTIQPGTGFQSGQIVMVSGVGGVGAISTSAVMTPIAVVDSTHIDLTEVSFTGGPYTSGGFVSWLP